MLRCRQTAEYIFGESDPVTIEKLRECDFGRLEGKTHKEMEKDPEYQAFLEAGGSLPYPGGESIEDFGARCIEGIKEVMEESIRRNYEQTACVVHGGVIMAVMHWLVEGSRHYYDWNPGNGEGYLLSIDTGAWKKGDYHGTVIAGITDRIYS